jgi:hypothetical protein
MPARSMALRVGVPPTAEYLHNLVAADGKADE